MAKTLTEKQLLEKLVSLKKEYHEATEKKTAKECAAISGRIKGVQAELTALWTKGALECPISKTPAIGVKRGPGRYEVGPSGTDSTIVGKGETVEDAVSDWNEKVKKYLSTQ